MRKKLFNYIGAKGFILKTLYANFPQNHLQMKYCEPFLGSGVVLYYKKPSMMEVVNDVDEGISALFWCLTNEFEKLCFRLQFATHSEAIYKWFEDYKPKTKLDMAVKAIYRIHMAFSGKQGDTFSRWPIWPSDGKKRDNRYVIFDYNMFLKWNQRFLIVQKYNEDFRTFFNRTDEHNAFFYCDPPYVTADDHYKHVFTEKDHKDLFKILSNLQGKFLLSYDNHPLIQELYQEFQMKEVQLRYYAGTSGRNKPRTELLIANYPLKTQKMLTDWIKTDPIKQMS